MLVSTKHGRDWTDKPSYPQERCEGLTIPRAQVDVRLQSFSVHFQHPLPGSPVPSHLQEELLPDRIQESPLDFSTTTSCKVSLITFQLSSWGNLLSVEGQIKAEERVGFTRVGSVREGGPGMGASHFPVWRTPCFLTSAHWGPTHTGRSVQQAAMAHDSWVIHQNHSPHPACWKPGSFAERPSSVFSVFSNGIQNSFLAVQSVKVACLW